jgi:cell division protein FtsQ
LMKDIDLIDIERKILRNNLIESCQVHAGMGVTLFIDVKLQEPIARFADGTGLGYYVNKAGDVFQLSNQYTSRVLMLTGSYFKGKKNLRDQFYENDVLQFINRVNDEAFWKAQITQINVDSVRNIKIVPLIGNHTVEFGRPINTEDKLVKLKYFYQQILPSNQYNNFKKVSVQYKGQIVCE